MARAAMSALSIQIAGDAPRRVAVCAPSNANANWTWWEYEWRPPGPGTYEIAMMVDRLRSLNGAGLAAPQIGASVKVVVVEVRKTDVFPDRPECPLLQIGRARQNRPNLNRRRDRRSTVARIVRLLLG